MLNQVISPNYLGSASVLPSITCVDAQIEAPRAILLGNFDGFHQGHQSLLNAVHSDINSSRLSVGVMSVEPHPRQFFGMVPARFRLTDRSTKQAVFRSFQFRHVFTPSFDKNFASLTPQEFAEKVIVQVMKAARIYVGTDYRFGARRSGDANSLRELGSKLGFDVTVVDPACREGSAISSTRVRDAIRTADFKTAEILLGYPWLLPISACWRQGNELVGRMASDIVLPPSGEYRGRLVDLSSARVPQISGTVRMSTGYEGSCVFRSDDGLPNGPPACDVAIALCG